MSLPENPLFETALSLQQSDRADLAFHLLQSLTPPGEEISTDELAAEIHARVAAQQCCDIKSFSLEEARAILQRYLPSNG